MISPASCNMNLSAHRYNVGDFVRLGFKAIIEYENIGSGLITKEKYGYVRDFRWVIKNFIGRMHRLKVQR